MRTLWIQTLFGAFLIGLFFLFRNFLPVFEPLNFPQFGSQLSQIAANACGANESVAVCAREWFAPITGFIAVLTVWYAARQVLESNRQSDAAVRSTLHQFRKDLIAERDLLREISESKAFASLGQLRAVTRGGYIHVEQKYEELEALLNNELSIESLEVALSGLIFGGELGQRRRELARLVHDIALDVFVVRQNLNGQKKEPEAERLDNIRFRTKEFFGLFHLYKVVVDEEIDTTAEAVSEFDDQNLREVRRRLVRRAERRWENRRKSIFELFLQRVTVPIDFGKPKKREEGSPREVSPFHINPDFHKKRVPVPRRAKRS